MLSEEFLDHQSGGHERIIEILVYLLDEMRKDTQLADIDLAKLSARGFTQSEISTAFSWLFDKVAITAKDGGSLATAFDPKARAKDKNGRPNSFRVYHEIERMVLSRDAQGYLLELRELGLMSESEMELLIDRLLMAGVSQVSTKDVKELAAGLIFDFEDSGRVGSRLMLNANDVIH